MTPPVINKAKREREAEKQKEAIPEPALKQARGRKTPGHLPAFPAGAPGIPLKERRNTEKGASVGGKDERLSFRQDQLN